MGGRQLGPAQIATCQTIAGNMNFAHHANGHRLPALIQNVNRGIAQRLAYGHAGNIGHACSSARARQFCRRIAINAGADRRLARPIGVVEIAPLAPVTCQRRRADFAGGNQGMQIRQGCSRCRQRSQGRRRQSGVGNGVLPDEFRQRLAGQQCLARGQMQAGTVGQRHHQLPGKGIEGAGGELQDAVPWLQGKITALPLRQIAQPAMRQQHALGLTGGAGSVNDISQICGLQHDRWQRGNGLGGDGSDSGIGVEAEPALSSTLICGQFFMQRRFADQQGRLCICHDPGDALGGLGAGQRQIGRPGLEHSQQGNDLLRATRQTQGNHAFRPQLRGSLTQVMRQLIAARIQLAISEPLLLKTQRQRLWLTRNPGGKQLLKSAGFLVLILALILILGLPGGIPRSQQLPLLRCQRIVIRQPRLRTLHDLLQQLHELVGQPL